MGMVGCFAAVSPETLHRLRREPDLMDEYLRPDDGESEPPNYVEVDKAWHGIHYLLTGVAEGGPPPAALAVFGGEAFGPEIGYGPARFLAPEQVAQVAAHLSGLSVEALRNRFDPKDMAAKGIYPKMIWVRDGSDALDYVLENYQQLVALYRDAAARGDAMIQWLS